LGSGEVLVAVGDVVGEGDVAGGQDALGPEGPADAVGFAVEQDVVHGLDAVFAGFFGLVEVVGDFVASPAGVVGVVDPELEATGVGGAPSVVLTVPPASTYGPESWVVTDGIEAWTTPRSYVVVADPETRAVRAPDTRTLVAVDEDTTTSGPKPAEETVRVHTVVVPTPCRSSMPTARSGPSGGEQRVTRSFPSTAGVPATG